MEGDNKAQTRRETATAVKKNSFHQKLCTKLYIGSYPMAPQVNLNT